MKKILILVLILNFACSNDDITEIQNNGTGGVSCLVNGQVLKPKTNSVLALQPNISKYMMIKA